MNCHLKHFSADSSGCQSSTADPIKAPVAFFVFNRPALTIETFASIRAFKPSQLFLIADGPRVNVKSDYDLICDVRSIIAKVDWPCSVHRNFSPINLGCASRVSSGLDWVFSLVDRAIVLEDDCIASPEFFSFCSELLERYAPDKRVWQINGNSYQPENNWGSASYYFSNYPDCWGWATWRRAWFYYQHDIPFLGAWERSEEWRTRFATKSERRYFSFLFRQALEGRSDSWFYRWIATFLYNGGLAATPNGNLVRNVGFGTDATHTTEDTRSHRIATSKVMFPLSHPSSVIRHHKADEYDRLFIRTDPSIGITRKALTKAIRLSPISLRKLVLSIRECGLR